jgi:hypothetical protein
MDDMVERLAKKGCEHFRDDDINGFRHDARWWLNAIADELEGHMQDVVWEMGSCKCDREALQAVEAFDWLRTQAGAPQEKP